MIPHLDLPWDGLIGSSKLLISGMQPLVADVRGIRYIIVTPNQLTAASLVLQYWVDRKKVNPGVWITIFLVTILLINYFGIRLFGEIEFWLSSFKVVTIVALILLSLILALGGGPDHDRKGFRYWSDPGAFKPYIADGDKG